jgi:alpha-methylacyl-CoA racemase
VAIDLKHEDGAATVLKMVERADALIEGFRPGVAERLGFGPQECLTRNPALVYGRITGWGQTGPYAHVAGHDINYIALAGTLHAIGRAGDLPVPPLNLVGDFGGGGMLLAFGLLCALREASISGQGQVIDAAMVDGAALLATVIHGALAMGVWNEERGTNLLDGGAPFYEVYECADGKYVSVGAIEPEFYAELLRLTGLAESKEPLPQQMARGEWPGMKQRFTALFKSKTRTEWCELLEGTNTCFAPVLSLSEAPQHPHNRERSTFINVAGVTQPAPAPRFSRTPGTVRSGPAQPGQHTIEGLADWGFTGEEITELRASRAVVQGNDSPR